LKKLAYASLLMLLAVSMVLAGCSQPGSTETQVPTIRVGYIFVDHHAPLFVAAKKGEAFQNAGVYLKPVVDKEKYEMYAGGKKVANIELVVSKSGSEAASLFAQKHLDLSLLSVTAAMSGIDSGTPIKIIAPLQTEGLALVFPSANPLNGWQDFARYLDSQPEPVKIGYHSPTSAPLMVFEGALKQNKIAYTRNANDLKAEILLVDLKDTSNFIPALNSKQVDGWVGPSPHPQVAEQSGMGKIVLDLRDLPPAGSWHDAPCCVIAGRSEFMEQNRDVVGKFLQLIAYAGDYANKNHDESAALVAQWIGIPVDAAKASNIVFLTYPTESWLKNLGVFQDLMNEMKKYKGPLKDRKFAEVKDLMTDFSYIQQTK